MFRTALKLYMTRKSAGVAPVRAGDLDATTAFLLRQCKSKDPEYKARAKAALAHISAARQLQALGYNPNIVNYVAAQAIPAAKGL